jgi:hypothetical protein
VVEGSKNRPLGLKPAHFGGFYAALKRRSSTVPHAVETGKVGYRSAQALRHPEAEYQRLKAQTGLSSYGMPEGIP